MADLQAGPINPFVASLDGKTVWDTDQVGGDFDLAQCMLWGEALAENATVTEILIRSNLSHVVGALLKALLKNKHITELVFFSNTLTASETLELAEVLQLNSVITTIDLADNGIGLAGTRALAEALKVNHTITTLNLNENKISDEGAVELAEGLKLNRGLKELSLFSCGVEDVGLLCLCDALRVNTTLHKVELGSSFYELKATASALRDLAPRVQYTLQRAAVPMTSFGAVLKSWPKDCVRRFAHSLFPKCKVAEIRKFGAVAAALINDVPLTLERMRVFPDNLAQMLVDTQGGSVVPWQAAGVIAEFIATEKQQETTAARAASVVAQAVRANASLAVVNLHICGEGYAGKTTTRHAIVKSMNNATRLLLSSAMPAIPLQDGRTLGMVSTVMDYRGLTGNAVRALLHDYGGQEEFRANHAAHLAAPNSVYLLVVPLWDMRPQQSPAQGPADRPMELRELVATYANWLKFINTVVEEKGARCITALNFSKLFQAQARQFTVQDAVEALMAIHEHFTANENCKLVFVGTPILLNANVPSSVHKHLVPVLKSALDALEATPVPVAPALQMVLADMAVPGKWPLFSYESDLRKLVDDAIAAKLSLPVSDFTEASVRADIVRTVSHITLAILEFRRDIVVFPVHTGERVSINHPNWLTEKLLGSLFDPKKRPLLNEAAAVTAAGTGSDPTHLLSAAAINDAVRSNLDASTRAMLDAQFLPKLLQHVGVCIPVVLDKGGFARGVAEGENLSHVTHWFPAFSTTRMKETDGRVLKSADHVTARLFKLSNPDFCVFPPGYFSSLFVSIVSLYSATNLVQLYRDGMELCSGADNFQVVVRRCADADSFVVTVATVGTPLGSSLAFDTMQSIKEFIFGPGSWRCNVHVQEFGLHPTKLLKSAPIPVASLEQRLRDPGQRAENLAFYFGTERQGPDRVVPLQLQAVLARLESLDKKADDHHAELVLSVDHIGTQVEALHRVLNGLEDTLARVDAMAADTTAQLQAMCELLTVALPTLHNGDGVSSSVEAQATTAAREFLQKRREMLDQTQELTAAQLQHLKAEIVGELSKLATDMQQRTFSKLEEMEQAQAAAEQRVHTSLAAQSDAAASALQDIQGDLAAQIGEVKAQGGGTLAAQSAQLQDSIMHLQESIAAVQTAQMNDVYGVYELPLLPEITSPEPTGTPKDLAVRCLYDVHVLHFLCPVCGEKAASGPKQQGYKLLVTKGWVAKVSKVLKVSLLALQVVSLVTPLPLPRVAELARYLPTEELRAVADALDFGMAHVMDQVNAGSQRLGSSATGVRTETPEITLEHVAAIRELLLLAGESSPPKLTGLSPAICAATQQCAWVCAGACRGKYMAQGDTCLAIKMKLV